MATQPMPGGVAAAAMAGAIGTALITKATRITLQKQTMVFSDQAELQTLLDHAQAQQISLVRLAGDDEHAYRVVLDTQALAAETSARRDAQAEAIEVPIRVAEACRSLLSSLPRLADICWPAVQHELQTGTWLLEVGLRAGLLAAETNLRAWGDHRELLHFQARSDALAQSSAYRQIGE